MTLPTIQQLTDDQLYDLCNELDANTFMFANKALHSEFHALLDSIGESISKIDLSKKDRDLLEEYADCAQCMMYDDEFDGWIKDVVGLNPIDFADDENDYRESLKD